MKTLILIGFVVSLLCTVNALSFTVSNPIEPSTNQSGYRSSAESMYESGHRDNSLSVPVAVADEGSTISHSVGTFSHSPWFALVSGLASILGLLLPLYATQVRPIPFSLYRSLVWRKVLLIAGGVGIAVFASAELAGLEGALRRVLDLVSAIGDHSTQFTYPSGYVLTLCWMSMTVFGVALSVKGIRFDPVAHARQVIIREQGFIGAARGEQVNAILRGRDLDLLTKPERRTLREVMDFYRYVQWRYADVVLGAPPPAFPLFREEALSSASEDDA